MHTGADICSVFPQVVVLSVSVRVTLVPAGIPVTDHIFPEVWDTVPDVLVTVPELTVTPTDQVAKSDEQDAGVLTVIVGNAFTVTFCIVAVAAAQPLALV